MSKIFFDLPFPLARKRALNVNLACNTNANIKRLALCRVQRRKYLNIYCRTHEMEPIYREGKIIDCQHHNYLLTEREVCVSEISDRCF